MGLIKGVPVVLWEEAQTGTDDWNQPIKTESPTVVENVLIAPVSEQEVMDMLTLHGARVVYQLGIPKGDRHDWHDKKVEFFGRTWHTVGDIVEGIEAMIPLDWNRKVRVEAFRG